MGPLPENQPENSNQVYFYSATTGQGVLNPSETVLYSKNRSETTDMQLSGINDSVHEFPNQQNQGQLAIDLKVVRKHPF